MRLIPTEEQEQMVLIWWAKAARVDGAPLAEQMYAIPNGGLRTARTAARLKAQGAIAGVPDLCIPIPSGGFHGLYVELKRLHGGRMTPEQDAWIHRLTRRGYAAVRADGAEKAISIIRLYLDQSGLQCEWPRL